MMIRTPCISGLMLLARPDTIFTWEKSLEESHRLDILFTVLQDIPQLTASIYVFLGKHGNAVAIASLCGSSASILYALIRYFFHVAHSFDKKDGPSDKDPLLSSSSPNQSPQISNFSSVPNAQYQHPPQPMPSHPIMQSSQPMVQSSQPMVHSQQMPQPYPPQHVYQQPPMNYQQRPPVYAQPPPQIIYQQSGLSSIGSDLNRAFNDVLGPPRQVVYVQPPQQYYAQPPPPYQQQQQQRVISPIAQAPHGTQGPIAANPSISTNGTQAEENKVDESK